MGELNRYQRAVALLGISVFVWFGFLSGSSTYVRTISVFAALALTAAGQFFFEGYNGDPYRGLSALYNGMAARPGLIAAMSLLGLSIAAIGWLEGGTAPVPGASREPDRTVVNRTPVDSSRAPYEFFRTLSAEERATFRLRLTWIGPQTIPMPTLTLCEHDPPFGDQYTAGVTADEIASIVSALDALLAGTDDEPIDRERTPMVITLSVVLPPEHIFRSGLTREQMAQVFDKLRETLKANDDAYTTVDHYAHIFGMHS